MSGYLTPAILYTDGGGAVTFIPTFPPVNKQPEAILEMNAVRHDSITQSGKKQSVLERIENLRNVEFAWVPASDAASWQRFFAWALAGNSFNWAPDSTALGTFTTYTLEDMSFSPKRVAVGYYSFTMKLRKVV